MAITTANGLISAAKLQYFITKGQTSFPGDGNPNLSYALGGFPREGTIPVGLSGVALNTSSTGAIVHPDAPAGQSTYCTRFGPVLQESNGSFGSSALVDVLWVSGNVAQVTTLQTINSVTFPARDVNGATNGEGVYIGLLHTTGYTVPNTFTATVSYTNSNSTPVSGRTASVTRSTALNSKIVPLSLDSGDTGVSSIQSFTFSALPGTGGSTALVAFRVIAMASGRSGRSGSFIFDESAIPLGMPKVYNGTYFGVISFIPSLLSNGFSLSQG